MQSAYFFGANFIWSTVRTAPHSGVHTLHVNLVHVRQYKTTRSWIVNNLIEAPFILPMFTLFLYSNFTGFFFLQESIKFFNLCVSMQKFKTGHNTHTFSTSSSNILCCRHCSNLSRLTCHSWLRCCLVPCILSKSWEIWGTELWKSAVPEMTNLRP